MQPNEAELLDANQAFYRAFVGRNVKAMDALWARRAPVACIHPGWGMVQGRAEVMASWRSILEGPTAQPIAVSRASAFVLGDAAFVVCTETLGGSELIATNLFTKEDGAWRLVHHQSGLVAQKTRAPMRPPSGALN